MKNEEKLAIIDEVIDQMYDLAQDTLFDFDEMFDVPAVAPQLHLEHTWFDYTHENDDCPNVMCYVVECAGCGEYTTDCGQTGNLEALEGNN